MATPTKADKATTTKAEATKAEATKAEATTKADKAKANAAKAKANGKMHVEDAIRSDASLALLASLAGIPSESSNRVFLGDDNAARGKAWRLALRAGIVKAAKLSRRPKASEVTETTLPRIVGQDAFKAIIGHYVKADGSDTGKVAKAEAVIGDKLTPERLAAFMAEAVEYMQAIAVLATFLADAPRVTATDPRDIPMVNGERIETHDALLAMLGLSRTNKERIGMLEATAEAIAEQDAEEAVI